MGQPQAQVGPERRETPKKMASLVKRTKQNGDTSYFLKWRDAGGAQHMKFAARLKKDADNALTDLRTQLRAEREGLTAIKPDMQTTLAGFCAEWIECVEVRERTRDEYRRLIESPTGLVATYGHLPLGAVTRANVRGWMNERAKAGAGRNTIRNGVAVIRGALADALEEGKLRENPCAVSRRRGRKSAIPGRVPLKITAPAPEIVEKLIAAAQGDFKVMLILAAACGLRRGEIFGLQWEDLSDDTRTLTIRRANIRGELVETKTEAGERTVPLFASARKALLEHRIASSFSQPEHLVFPDVVGRPLNPDGCSHHYLKAAIKAAGLPERAIRFHALRHFAVSRLIEEGANIVLLAKVAGHASPDVTLRVYSHLMPSGAADAADKYDPIATTIKEAVNG